MSTILSVTFREGTGAHYRNRTVIEVDGMSDEEKDAILQAVEENRNVNIHLHDPEKQTVTELSWPKHPEILKKIIQDLELGTVFPSGRVPPVFGVGVGFASKPDNCFDSDKAEKLREKIDPKRVFIANFERLLSGDLSDIGDALIAGKTVLLLPGKDTAHDFSGRRSDYVIEPERIEVGGVSWPKGETEAPPIGTQCYFPNLTHGKVSGVVWTAVGRHTPFLSRGIIHLTKAAARQHLDALIELSTGGAR